MTHAGIIRHITEILGKITYYFINPQIFVNFVAQTSPKFRRTSLEESVKIPWLIILSWTGLVIISMARFRF